MGQKKDAGGRIGQNEHLTGRKAIWGFVGSAARGDHGERGEGQGEKISSIDCFLVPGRDVKEYSNLLLFENETSTSSKRQERKKAHSQPQSQAG